MGLDEEQNDENLALDISSSSMRQKDSIIEQRSLRLSSSLLFGWNLRLVLMIFGYLGSILA